MLMELIILIIGILYLTIQFHGSVSIMEALRFVNDPPTIICMMILILPTIVRKDRMKDLKTAFSLMKKGFSCSLGVMKQALDALEFLQKQILYAGLIVSLYPLILVLIVNKTVENWGPSLSITFIAILYTVILELLILPLQVEIKRRIIDYMEEE